LATTDDARVHCAVLKIRAVPARAPPHYAAGRPGPRDGSTPVPSGPNSVLGQAVPPPPFQPRRAVLTGLSDELDRITSAPQMSCHLGTFARDMALDAALLEDRARCSLERR